MNHPTSPRTNTSQEIVHVTTKKVHCDGGADGLGHPLVYLNMGDDDSVECGYCDRLFILKK